MGLTDGASYETCLTYLLNGGGSIGLTTVVQAPPDGSAFLFTTSSVTMVPTIYPKLGFDPLRDLTSISLVTEVPISLAVRAEHPARDLTDLIAKAKAAPGKYTFASGGVGTGNHLAGELLRRHPSAFRASTSSSATGSPPAPPVTASSSVTRTSPSSGVATPPWKRPPS